jgi:hypothetical protein
MPGGVVKVLLELCVVLVLCAYQVEACTCIAPKTEDAFSTSDVVYIGTVKDIVLVGNPMETSWRAQRTMVTFSISTVFKGEIQNSVVIHTSYGGLGCGGYRFEQGHEYLVYAKRRPVSEWLNKKRRDPVGMTKNASWILDTTPCSRTERTSSPVVQHDLKELVRLVAAR